VLSQVTRFDGIAGFWCIDDRELVSGIYRWLSPSSTDALVVRQLKPWHENLSKRQVKAPKIFIRDSGLLHALLNLATQRDLEGHH
jgi:predicted AAA+ superfamily ATPase